MIAHSKNICLNRPYHIQLFVQAVQAKHFLRCWGDNEHAWGVLDEECKNNLHSSTCCFPPWDKHSCVTTGWWQPVLAQFSFHDKIHSTLYVSTAGQHESNSFHLKQLQCDASRECVWQREKQSQPVNVLHKPPIVVPLLTFK